MLMDLDFYMNLFGKWVWILFLLVRFSFFIVVVLFFIVVNVVYIRNGGGLEWLGLVLVILFWLCLVW